MSQPLVLLNMASRNDFEQPTLTPLGSGDYDSKRLLAHSQ